MPKFVASFSARLNEALTFNRCKQIELSRRTGIARSALCDYLKGLHVPRQDKLIAIANALEVDAGWLMGLDVPMRRNSNEHNIDNQIMTMVAHLNDRGKTEVLKRATELSKLPKYKKAPQITKKKVILPQRVL